MMVLDASAVLEVLLEIPAGVEVQGHIADAALALHVPHLLDLEVAQVQRRYASVYDAVYVALAEMLDASLVTSDRRLAHAPGLKGRAILI